MKRLQNNFTTVEQGKRLLELGVPRWSADEYRDQKGYRHSLEGILDVELFFQNFPDYLPCWSVGRLLEIIALCTYRNTPEYDTDYIECLIEVIESRVWKKEGIDFSKLEE